MCLPKAPHRNDSFPGTMLSYYHDSRGEPTVRKARTDESAYRWYTPGGRPVQLAEHAAKHMFGEDDWFAAWNAFKEGVGEVIDEHAADVDRWNHMQLANEGWGFVLSWDQRRNCLVCFHINAPAYNTDPRRRTLLDCPCGGSHDRGPGSGSARAVY
jgi:hypothetical protein